MSLVICIPYPISGRGVVGTGWSWLRIGTCGGTCEYSDEPLGSKNGGNFLTSCRTS